MPRIRAILPTFLAILTILAGAARADDLPRVAGKLKPRDYAVGAD